MKIVESNDDILLYDIGHVPGAVKIDWRGDLSDPVTRDYLDGARFTQLMRTKGIGREDTVVIYGDRGNAQAAHTAWIFGLFGHQDVRLLDGGRDAWISEERDTTFDQPVTAGSDYPEVTRDDYTARIFRDELLGRLGAPLVDVRAPQEYSGEAEAFGAFGAAGASGAGQEFRTVRGGHVPTAVNIPWTAACGADGRFRSRAELDALYDGLGPEAVVYSRGGERSSHTWFVLTYLLGRDGVRNYDGSWIEWGNSVRLPIAVGSEPGVAPANA